jgi:probable HAF family extracellular repeat protein
LPALGGKWDDADGGTGLAYVLELNNGSVATFNYTPLVNFNRQDSPDIDLVADYAIRDASGNDVTRQRIRFNVEPVDDAPVVRNDGYVNLNGSGFLYVPGQNNAFAFEGRAAFTLEAWVRPTVRQHMEILTRYTGGVYANYILALSDSGQLAIWRDAAPHGWIIDTSANGALPLNAWSHVAATYNGSTMRLYVNGQLRLETSDQRSTGSGLIETRVGARGDGWTSMVGDLDELRVWNVARTETELRMSYRSPLSGFETGLIGYYRFDEGFGVWAFDLSKEVDDTKENMRISGTVNWITNGDTPTKTVVVPEDHAGFEIFVAALEFDRSQTITLGEPTQPSNGRVVRRASAAGGTAYVYTPNPDFSGPDSFRYTASANGVSASGTVSIQVENINDPPVISNLDNLVLQEESTHRIPFNVNDVDSSTVVVSALSSDGTILPSANVTVTGSGSNRYLQMTPYEGAYGLTTITVTATDTIDTVQKSITVSFVPRLAYSAMDVNDPGQATESFGTAIDDFNRVAGYYHGTGVGAVDKPIFHEQMLFNGSAADVGTMAGQITSLKLHLNGTNHFAVGFLTANAISTPWRFSRILIDDRIAAASKAYAAETDPTRKDAAAAGASANAFVGIRETTNSLSFPAEYRSAFAMAVNAVGALAGYLTKADGTEYPMLLDLSKTIIATENVLKDNSNALITGRALAINRFNLATGYRWISGKKRAITHNGSVLADLPLPSGAVETVGTGIDDTGVVVGYLIKSDNKRQAIAYRGGVWKSPSGTFASTWVQSEATAINTFGQIVGEATLADGSRKAFLWIGDAAYDLNAILPLGTNWKLDRANAINSAGQIVGTGRISDGTKDQIRAFLATPASVIGKRVARPEGTVARYPLIDILEASPGDNASNAFFWSDVERALFAIRPVKATIRWHRNNNLAAIALDVVPRLTVTTWPKIPEIHIAGSPVEVEPVKPDSLYSYYALHYTTTPGATVDSVTKVFNTSEKGIGHSVVRYLKSGDLTQDSTTQSNLFHVVRTHLWNDPALLTGVGWPIGTPIRDAYHNDYPGRNGYLFFAKTAVDSIGTDAAYNRSERTGTIIPVNELHPESPIGDQSLVVVWYKMNNDLNVAWPSKPVIYTPSWPVDVNSIVIASTRGSDPFGVDPITAVTYPDARIYNQPVPGWAGFNPNEEHAMILPGSVAEAAYALRNDLNEVRNYSKPYVLLKYRHPVDGLWRHRVYQVITEQRPFLFDYPATAGTEIQPPYPLSILPVAAANNISAGQELALEDYNGKIYARQAGIAGAVNNSLILRLFYPMQPGFWYDLDGNGSNDLGEGAFIPWLDRSPGTTVGTPIPVRYTVRWPDAVPTLEVGDTLFEAKKGLPGVANWASAQMVYDTLNPTFTNSFRIGAGYLTVPPTNVVRLFDPMSERVLPAQA